MISTSDVLIILILLCSPCTTTILAFLSSRPFRIQRLRIVKTISMSSPQTTPTNETISIIGVVAPLIYIGPYACLGLKFPHLDSNFNSIHFVLDTGANVNSISQTLAQKLNLSVITKKEQLSLLGAAGAGGSFEAGDIVKLGDCQLLGLPEPQQITFMTNITAAAVNLGIAESVGGGLLGASFFHSFPAGVELDWYGTDGDPPTVIFYYGKDLPEDAKKNCIGVTLEKESFFGIPTIMVNINGIDVRAIIDTGSPITIISPTTARQIGIQTEMESSINDDDASKNSSSRSMIRIKGIDDRLLGLSRTFEPVSISIGNSVPLGNLSTVFVGELPGLSKASIYSSAPYPQVLLGLDALRRTYRMIVRLPKNELWFEPLPEQ